MNVVFWKEMLSLDVQVGKAVRDENNLGIQRLRIEHRVKKMFL